MKTLFRQMLRASRFDVQTYEQVEADRSGNAAAVVVVLVASVAAAIGSGARDLVSIVGATVALLVTWVFWVALTYFIGTHLLPEPQTHADVGEVLRTTGFSASPGVLRILGALPGVGLPIGFGGSSPSRRAARLNSMTSSNGTPSMTMNHARSATSH